jgi:DNA invertase Pin-like site-specific DNA recombinase
MLQELRAKDVDLYLHQQGLDTSTPSGRALFQMLGVFSEFEREMIKDRVGAGLARAKDDGVVLGRPKLEDTDPHRAAPVRTMRASGVGVRNILDPAERRATSVRTSPNWGATPQIF